jgi:hypothetical protein
MAKKTKVKKDADGARCPECGGLFHDCTTDDPYDDETRCVDCGYLLRTVSHSREFGPRFEEIQAAAAAENPEPETVGVEYPHCACGAVLALESEKAAGKCEACHAAADFLEPVAPSDSAPSTEDVKPEGTPVNVPLPFPTPPPEPFDEHAAFLDICTKNATVKSLERVYLELKERTKSAKDQWEAAASTASGAIAEYDRKSRDADEYAIRQEKLQAAYVEKLEADAATAAQPELPIEPPLVTAADRVPDLASAAPIGDALPACACGNALALDTELVTGHCEACGS